jgi:hypothetical protein
MTHQPSEVPADHPLRRLDGRPLAGGRLRLFPGPTSRYGALYFSLHLERDGSLSSEPVLVALHHSGPYPSYNWIEVAQLNDEISFEASDSGPPLTLGVAGLHRLMALLGQLIPPGGHLMTEYESPRWTLTARALNLGAPPAATELGDLLKANPQTKAGPGQPGGPETRSCGSSWLPPTQAHSTTPSSTPVAGRVAC